jgi:hypothetical protein
LYGNTGNHHENAVGSGSYALIRQSLQVAEDAPHLCGGNNPSTDLICNNDEVSANGGTDDFIELRKHSVLDLIGWWAAKVKKRIAQPHGEAIQEQNVVLLL